MNKEPTILPMPEEARAALAEAEHLLAHTRRALSQGPTAGLLILWGAIWMAADLTTQFDQPAMQWLWAVLDVIGIVGWVLIALRSRTTVKEPGRWRFGAAWGILFFYASLWMSLLVTQHWPQTAEQWQQFEPEYRRMSAFMHTIPMFAYVVAGLWLGRFFVILGGVVTVLIVGGLYFIPDYFFLWAGVTGGGALILSGIFVRKLWR
jgi:hypothetical protein